MLYEPPNRGGKTIAAFNRGVGGNDPGSMKDASLLANSFLMPRVIRYPSAAGTSRRDRVVPNFNTTITLPIARNRDGSSITGPSYEYIVNAGDAYELTYPAATLDQSKATLTHRMHLNDMPQTVPASGWRYTREWNRQSSCYPREHGLCRTISMNSATPRRIPRSTVSVLRRFAIGTHGFGTKARMTKVIANPLAGDITRIYTEVVSQPGRFLNDFRYLGFNQAENGKQVFDGMMQWIAAGDGISMNYRWSQPGRTERNRQDHLYVEGRFPFANVITTDPITGKTDSRYAKCTATNTCPFAMEIFSANEYWVKAASLMTTDPTGTKDLPDSPFTRIYFMSSMQHGTGNGAVKGQLPAISKSAGFAGRAESAVHRIG